MFGLTKEEILLKLEEIELAEKHKSAIADILHLKQYANRTTACIIDPFNYR
ncbi:hypothetical protein ACQKEY_06725 [Lysinibacillus fusiformis]|uniref:hypothetical protein n=1 Tax=Lysinibacillus fusiformis TaxID=28031 RepID=UPI003D02B12C